MFLPNVDEHICNPAGFRRAHRDRAAVERIQRGSYLFEGGEVRADSALPASAEGTLRRKWHAKSKYYYLYSKLEMPLEH